MWVYWRCTTILGWSPWASLTVLKFLSVLMSMFTLNRWTTLVIEKLFLWLRSFLVQFRDERWDAAAHRILDRVFPLADRPCTSFVENIPLVLGLWPQNCFTLRTLATRCIVHVVLYGRFYGLSIAFEFCWWLLWLLPRAWLHNLVLQSGGCGGWLLGFRRQFWDSSWWWHLGLGVEVLGGFWGHLVHSLVWRISKLLRLSCGWAWFWSLTSSSSYCVTVGKVLRCPIGSLLDRVHILVHWLCLIWDELISTVSLCGMLREVEFRAWI